MGELEELFAALDTDSDGVLSKNELLGFLADMDYTDDEAGAMIDSWIEIADSNGDGLLDK